MLNDEEMRTVNEHLAQITVLQCLLLSVVRSLPRELQAETLKQFDEEVGICRTMLVNSTYPESFLEQFDNNVARLNALRLDIPTSL